MARLAAYSEAPGNRGLTVFVAVVIGAIVLALASMTTADPDLWGHVRFGLDIIRDGHVHRTDPYSFTSDRAWINHEWLAEVLFAAAYTGGGTSGILFLKLLLVGGAGALTYRTLRIGASAHQSRMLMLIVVAALMPLSQSVRPQLFSIFGFGVLLALLLGYRSSGGSWRLVAVPLVFAVWANAHGGWILGQLTMWAVLAPVVWTAPAATRLRIAVVVVAAALASLANPYGFTLVLFLIETLGSSRPEITEWSPVFASGLDSIALWVGICGVAAYWCQKGFWRRHPIYALAILAFAILSFQVVRLVGFFAVITVALLSVDGSHWPELPPRRTLRVSTVERLVLGVALCAALGFTAWNLRCIRLTSDWVPDPSDTRFVQNALPHGRLLVWFDWGEYAIWHMGPRVQVSFDGRRETVYSSRLIAEHLSLYAARPGWNVFLDRLAPDLIWIPATLPLVRYLPAHGWQVVHQSTSGQVFARGWSPDVAPSTASVSGRRCFPGL
jgi:hypothetical protein